MTEDQVLFFRPVTGKGFKQFPFVLYSDAFVFAGKPVPPLGFLVIVQPVDHWKHFLGDLGVGFFDGWQCVFIAQSVTDLFGFDAGPFGDGVDILHDDSKRQSRADPLWRLCTRVLQGH